MHRINEIGSEWTRVFPAATKQIPKTSIRLIVAPAKAGLEVSIEDVIGPTESRALTHVLRTRGFQRLVDPWTQA